MAMTKKERAELDRLLNELRILSALRWTEAVEPDLAPPERSSEIVNGYLPIGVSSDLPRVTDACTSSVNHGHQHGKTSTQNARRLYSTRLLALKALRHAVERDCAERLAYVDRQIEGLAS